MMASCKYKFLLEVTASAQRLVTSEVQQMVRTALEGKEAGRGRNRITLSYVSIREPLPSLEERVTDLEVRLDRLNEDPDY